jgi:hypothetical protein
MVHTSMRWRTRFAAMVSLLVLEVAYLGCGSSSDHSALPALVDASDDASSTVESDGSNEASVDADAAVGDVSSMDGNSQDATIEDGAPDGTTQDGAPPDGTIQDSAPGGEAGLDGSSSDHLDASAETGPGNPDAADGGATNTVVLTMDAFTVGAQQEVYICQQFGNPFGADVDLVSLSGTESNDLGEVFVFNMAPDTGRNVAAPGGSCPGAGLERHPFAYFTQTPNFSVHYPPASGYHLPAANGLMLYAHYLNVGSVVVHPTVKISMTTAAPDTVTTYIGHLFLENLSFSVQPTDGGAGNSYVDSAALSSGSLPATIQLLSAQSRMHQYGSAFKATANGTTLYTNDEWSGVTPTTFGSPLAVSNSVTVSWQCAYTNPTRSPMNAGTSLVTDDACIFIADYEGADPAHPDFFVPLQ